MHASLRIVIGDRVALCEPLQDDRRVLHRGSEKAPRRLREEPLQDDRRVLCAVQLDDDQVQRALERQLLAVESVACEAWGDLGRSGELWGGMGRHGEAWGRYGEIWGRYGGDMRPRA